MTAKLKRRQRFDKLIAEAEKRQEGGTNQEEKTRKEA